ncbi:MAG TPA: hypothetical protein VF033_04990 [Steroidobacteraceae bacterium]|jgi:hypothetical protein
MAAVPLAACLALSCHAHAAGTWCLGFDRLGPVRAGMSVEQVLALADFSGMERRQPADRCWYLSYEGRKGQDPAFKLMIIDGRVVRIELAGSLHTLSGAHLGSSEQDLRKIYGGRLDSQPHKYDENGRTFTYRSSDGAHGLRFETSSGKVTAIQAGPWEHLNYVEGCS